MGGAVVQYGRWGVVADVRGRMGGGRCNILVIVIWMTGLGIDAGYYNSRRAQYRGYVP
jgi:hypothetical protein